jgi:ribosomal protein L7/L12
MLSMSDPTQIQCVLQTQMQWAPQITLILIGGGLSIFGGFIAVVVRLRLEKKQEIEYIKTSLIDELAEIVTTISDILKTQDTAKYLPQIYFDNLSQSIDSFSRHKQRLFIIQDAILRKGTYAFYKKLESAIKNSKNVVGGSLDDNDAKQTAEVAKVVASLNTIKTDAEKLENNLNNYKFRTFWFCKKCDKQPQAH